MLHALPSTLRWYPLVLAGALSLLWAAAGCSEAGSEARSAKAAGPGAGTGAGPGAGGPTAVTEIRGKPLTISGPFTHENLAVYVLSAEAPDDRTFLTLDEGLKSGQVVVSEKADAQVHELQIENKSDQPLFLQEGDRLVGGQQDRIVQYTLVVPPKSGTMPIPSMCVEQSRWTPGGNGAAFGYSANAAPAPREVRAASKMQGDQGRVWQSVAKFKQAATTQMGSTNNTSSLTETLDSAPVKATSDAYAKALADVLAKHPKAAGVALAINGQIQEVDVYPGTKLLGKLYPRLVESYAASASLASKDANTPAPAATAVAAFMKQDKVKASHQATINAGNRSDIVEMEGKASASSNYNGQIVHDQWMKQESSSAPTPDLNQR